jgi:hypothetical protein
MAKPCPSCGANVADEGAAFCSACGDILGAPGGIGQRFEGGTGNMVAAPNATFHGPLNLSNVTHHHGPVAAPLDLSPSFVTTASFNNKTFFHFSTIAGAIGFVSGLFGIFGTNIFEVMDGLGLGWDWLKRIPFYWIAFGFFALAAANYFEYFRHVKMGLPAFDRYPFVRDDRLNWIVVRRVCPRCRGTMAPKKLGPSPGNAAATTVWECSRNADHKLPFDQTEVEDAISEGGLGHILTETA